MKENVFNKEAFIEDVKENVKNLYRKTLDEASQQEIFQAVSYTVKDVIIDDWLATQKAFGLLHVHGVFNGSCAWQQHDQFKNVQRGQRGTRGDRSELR